GVSGSSLKSSRSSPALARANRKLGLGVKEVQTTELGRETDLIAPSDRGLGTHPGNTDAIAAHPGLQHNLGAELFDDFDAGIEPRPRRAIAEHQMFRPHAHDQAPARVSGERARIARVHVESE